MVVITKDKRTINWAVVSIQKRYTEALPIKSDNYDHLQALKKVIHKEYHKFHDSLEKK